MFIYVIYGQLLPNSSGLALEQCFKDWPLEFVAIKVLWNLHMAAIAIETEYTMEKCLESIPIG